MGCNYSFPTGSAEIGIPFGAECIGKKYLQIKFGMTKIPKIKN